MIGGGDGKFAIKIVFDEQTHIDLEKFANKFGAAYEIIKKWYNKDEESATEWKVQLINVNRKWKKIFLKKG